MADRRHFLEGLAGKGLSQTELVVALVWLADHGKTGASVATGSLAKELNEHGLCGQINVSRLNKALRTNKHVVRGERTGEFRLRAASRVALDQEFIPLLGSARIRPSDTVIPRAQFDGRRQTWRALVTEINGCYDHGFFDGAAVLARRLVEALIVDAFRMKGAEAAIKTPRGDFMMLDGLIGVISSGAHLKLSRSARPTLEPIKAAGDTAAHSPHHITTKQDVDQIATPMRTLISELLNIIDGH